MSIYVIRHGERYKIGFSDKVAERVHHHLSGLPKDAVALGCMPGGREVEAHLHELFADSNLGAEWFSESDALLAFIANCLVAVPAPALLTEKGTPRADKQLVADALRQVAVKLWPLMTHKARTQELAALTGISARRMKCLYGAERYTMTPDDVARLEPFLNKNKMPIFETARAADSRRKLRRWEASERRLVRVISTTFGRVADWIAPEAAS